MNNRKDGKIVIAIIDSHAIYRDSLSAVLAVNKNFFIIGEYSSPEDASDIIKEAIADVLIVDAEIIKTKAPELISFINKYSPDSKILALSNNIGVKYAKQIRQCGAHLCLPKTSPVNELYAVLERVSSAAAW